MPRIDLYLSSLVKFGATGILLQSGKNVALRFPSGPRFATQTTGHAEIVALVNEIAPREQQHGLRSGEPTTFEYTFGDDRYSVRVEPRPGAWQVTIEPGTAAPPITADLPIERHSYEEVTAKAPASRAASVAPIFGGRPCPAKPGRVDAPSLPSVAPTPSDPAPYHTVASDRTMDRLLRRMVDMGASDLHLSTGSRPFVRVHGEMRPLEDQPVLSAEDLRSILDEITPERNRAEMDVRHDTDYAYAIEGVSRFRVNLYLDRHGPGAVLRAIPFRILTPAELGLPPKVLELCNLTKGLVLVTGPTGSGKSTTLATLVDVVNQTRADHIITIEDPIEFVHENKRCLVNQREVHLHTHSFKDALRAALREDPDVVLVGEMRDLETIAIAVETAETGHLVFGTLHTTTAPSTVDRIIDQFPADRQEQIRQMLAESLRGVIAQTLCKKIGGGRVAAYEILIANNAVANLIRERKTFQLFSLMQTGRAHGMITLNDSLLDLVRRKQVDSAEAYLKAVQKQEFKQLLSREGFGLP